MIKGLLRQLGAQKSIAAQIGVSEQSVSKVVRGDAKGGGLRVALVVLAAAVAEVGSEAASRILARAAEMLRAQRPDKV
ncbi:hypothetical protein [Rhodospirillum rubrum]|uniref:Uncharacterized protein n=1 Tax=Rhodospirillum rubrum (strain ATCC 11170 / ATH 1.1.1 / DSM 467 / LMG 4362 / NCIMB 8255 / S1) TaxID=269796 RepID=Q2RY25_RHORT|nr:hypothetical protein [Rhodospirillum rubrum]ABC20970.1 hypothetical protein Rru_A0165 [Rhodospirillum rubrum ATCC 11170]AEO46637.1 hypothetical protein F11_00835 [Rhodospirillum rubrum F11]MBK5952526.1 hypothetical protein [Rhodospirillum rubrum]QXG80669.1 hypothetical protein KUL73_00885 [Rhodospirillum rubrum]HCF17938.1 hypothetical protein [Rhodospirillum rubrum]